MSTFRNIISDWRVVVLVATVAVATVWFSTSGDDTVTGDTTEATSTTDTTSTTSTTSSTDSTTERN